MSLSLSLSAELERKIGDYFAIAAIADPPNPFAGSADWEHAWPILLADTIEIVTNEQLLTDAGTGAVLELSFADTPNPPSELPFTVELCDVVGSVLASHTYTQPMPPRANRPTRSTWKQATADACHAITTLIADLAAALQAHEQPT